MNPWCDQTELPREYRKRLAAQVVTGEVDERPAARHQGFPCVEHPLTMGGFRPDFAPMGRGGGIRPIGALFEPMAALACNSLTLRRLLFE